MSTDASKSPMQRPLASATIHVERYTFSEGNEIPRSITAKLNTLPNIPVNAGGRIVAFAVVMFL